MIQTVIPISIKIEEAIEKLIPLGSASSQKLKTAFICAKFLWYNGAFGICKCGIMVSIIRVMETLMWLCVNLDISKGYFYTMEEDCFAIEKWMLDIFGVFCRLPIMLTLRITLKEKQCKLSEILAFHHVPSQEVLPLTRMFQEGQTVVCKVISAAPVEWGSSKVSVSLSTDPADVNGSLTPLALQKGMVLQAAVSSVEDHGYTMDCGIEGVSAFLSRAEAAAFIKKSNAGHALAVGQLLQCAVLTETRGGRALQLTARPSTVNAPVELEDFSLDHVLPGFRAEVTVMEVMYFCLLLFCFRKC